MTIVQILLFPLVLVSMIFWPWLIFINTLKADKPEDDGSCFFTIVTFFGLHALGMGWKSFQTYAIISLIPYYLFIVVSLLAALWAGYKELVVWLFPWCKVKEFKSSLELEG